MEEWLCRMWEFKLKLKLNLDDKNARMTPVRVYVYYQKIHVEWVDSWPFDK